MSADVLAKKPNDEVKDRGLSAHLPAEPPFRKVFKDSQSGCGATIRGWQQCVVRGRAVGLRALEAVLLVLLYYA